MKASLVARFAFALFAVASLVPWSAYGALPGTAAQVDALLAEPEAPPGVVFEVSTTDSEALGWALPQINREAARLRARFPKLPMAVVTHGREQFALQREHRTGNESVHRQVESLVADQDIPVHVCETFAGWRGVSAEQFPDYVDVAPEGPAQIHNYEELGYIRVRVRRE
ncbi:MAG: hypothetical protein P8009_07255 [Gammaproteobacteria bacterium]